MALRGEKLPTGWRLWAHITVAALFANAPPYPLFALAEERVASSTAAILNATTPLWTVLIALAVRHGPPVRASLIAGLLVGFGGTLLPPLAPPRPSVRKKSVEYQHKIST